MFGIARALSALALLACRSLRNDERNIAQF